MITAVLRATNASKVNARNPKVMFILQSRFKVPVSMVLLYENKTLFTTGMRQSAILQGQATKWGDSRALGVQAHGYGLTAPACTALAAPMPLRIADSSVAG